jgi:hypothetical protein
MNRKDVVIGFLLGLCLTVTLFAVVPTRSQSGVYDPWNDVNDDGVIDMADISIAIESFMASGDPTKNVTITGHANKLAYTVDVNLNAGNYFYAMPISVDGYSKMTICIYTTSTLNWFGIQTCHFGGDKRFTMDIVTNFAVWWVKTYDVPNQEIFITLRNDDAGVRNFVIDVYLIP